MRQTISPLIAALLLCACGNNTNTEKILQSTPGYSLAPDTVLTVYLHSVAGEQPSWLLFDRVRYVAGKEISKLGAARIPDLVEAGFMIENDRKKIEKAEIAHEVSITNRISAESGDGLAASVHLELEEFREDIENRDRKRFRHTPFRITVREGQINTIEEIYIP